MLGIMHFLGNTPCKATASLQQVGLIPNFFTLTYDSESLENRRQEGLWPMRHIGQEPANPDLVHFLSAIIYLSAQRTAIIRASVRNIIGLLFDECSGSK